MPTSIERFLVPQPIQTEKPYNGKDPCMKCLWCWQKSLITKNPADDGIYCCYKNQWKLFHEQVDPNKRACIKYSAKRGKCERRFPEYGE